MTRTTARNIGDTNSPTTCSAKARFYHAVCEAHLSRIIQVDKAAQQFSYDIDENARTLAERMDGKLLLVSNV